MGELVEMFVFMRHLGFKRRYTFYTAAIGRMVTLKAGEYKGQRSDT